MRIEIITPEKSLFKGEAKAVTVPSLQGPFTMLEHHAAIVAILQQGNILVTLDDDSVKTIPIKGGCCEQHDDRIIVCGEELKVKSEKLKVKS